MWCCSAGLRLLEHGHVVDCGGIRHSVRSHSDPRAHHALRPDRSRGRKLGLHVRLQEHIQDKGPPGIPRVAQLAAYQLRDKFGFTTRQTRCIESCHGNIIGSMGKLAACAVDTFCAPRCRTFDNALPRCTDTAVNRDLPARLYYCGTISRDTQQGAPTGVSANFSRQMCSKNFAIT